MIKVKIVNTCGGPVTSLSRICERNVYLTIQNERPKCSSQWLTRYTWFTGTISIPRGRGQISGNLLEHGIMLYLAQELKSPRRSTKREMQQIYGGSLRTCTRPIGLQTPFWRRERQRSWRRSKLRVRTIYRDFWNNGASKASKSKIWLAFMFLSRFLCQFL